ncbi:hypothetical protein [Acidithiobacillus sulfuriphilus]|uniref:hypothetical protein n=1 Tax=Acidithiobacillus sulfuriphilus TaxID=1867749 RepID=UPI003F6033D8
MPPWEIVDYEPSPKEGSSDVGESPLRDYANRLFFGWALLPLDTAKEGLAFLQRAQRVLTVILEGEEGQDRSSYLLSVDPATQTLQLRLPEPPAPAELLAPGRLVLVIGRAQEFLLGFLAPIHALFSQSLQVGWPTTIYQLQKRLYWRRLVLSLAKVRLRRPGQPDLLGDLVDLGWGGLGMRLPWMEDLALQRGAGMEVLLSAPGSPDWESRGELRHWRRVEEAGSIWLRVGLRFDLQPKQHEELLHWAARQRMRLDG